MDITAKLDRKGSEGAKCNHYVFGKVGAPVSGGLYINKGTQMPDKIVITFGSLEDKGEKADD